MSSFISRFCFSLLFLLVGVAGLHAQTAPPSEELVKKYHAFDFWIGEWDVYKSGTDSIVGKSVIQSIINGVALQENYHSLRGSYEGKSLNKYNPFTKEWEQFWVDNSGLTLHLHGDYSDGKMVMGNEVEREGGSLANRITWTAHADGTVRQGWEQSTDKGESWTAIFDGLYKRTQ